MPLEIRKSGQLAMLPGQNAIVDHMQLNSTQCYTFLVKNMIR
ncbi:hypothetical protein HanXRQr2_Chr11g0508501 [Helianthus annuus]|uniref:Uncharacterized protein n=1 Tax=Helianthus annuus TaxID=4232 RepID=A0A9K3N1F8_HELAN|nr:hypothetical protein HanXRQr2_Chr11g0508501 [Helianthus annuus]